MDLKTWVFEISQGNYDIDLGDSNAPCQSLTDLEFNSNIVLDYGWDQGSLDLRKEISKLYNCNADEILVTHGAQEGLFLIYLQLIKKGDEIIALTPGWPQSFEAPKKLGGKVISIPILKKSKFNIEGVKDALSDRTKILVLNSPNNPNTYEINNLDIENIKKVIGDREITIVFDDEYLSNLEMSHHRNFSNSISVSSISKIYGFPGLRIGWIKSNKYLTNKLREMKHLTSISNSVLNENLATNILREKERYISDYKRMWDSGKEILEKWIYKHRNTFTDINISSAPFAWIRLHEGIDSLDFCKHMIRSERIMIMPSNVFGIDQHIRLTFVRDIHELSGALDRISYQIKNHYVLNENSNE